MKHFITALSIAILFAVSAPAYAQQQINNDGASGSEIQQQADSTYYQNNVGSNQQTSPVAPNAGAAVIQNAPDQELNVTGAPANTSTPEEKTPFRWLILAGLFLAILMSPALLYARDIQQKEAAVSSAPVVAEEPKKKSKPAAKKEEKVEEPVEKVVAELPSKEATLAPKKKSSKKKPASKVKRSKKKKK